MLSTAEMKHVRLSLNVDYSERGGGSQLTKKNITQMKRILIQYYVCI